MLCIKSLLTDTKALSQYLFVVFLKSDIILLRVLKYRSDSIVFVGVIILIFVGCNLPKLFMNFLGKLSRIISGSNLILACKVHE